MELGPEDNGIGRIRQKVYLITFARVLAQTALANPRLKDPSTMNRQTIMNVVRDAVDHPMLGSGGGRPADREASPIEKIVVFREKHRDGSFHFHVGLQLSVALGFVTAKRALLLRHSLVSHWSSTHTVVVCCAVWLFSESSEEAANRPGRTAAHMGKEGGPIQSA